MTRRYTFRRIAAWGPRFSCSSCGWEGEWAGSRCPRCGNMERRSNHEMPDLQKRTG